MDTTMSVGIGKKESDGVALYVREWLDCLELNDGGSVDLLVVGSLCRGIWTGWMNS